MKMCVRCDREFEDDHFYSNSFMEIGDIYLEITGTVRIGIEYVEIGEDYIKARMPVDKRTIQPYGILHGGASLVLAETLGSVAATLCVDIKKERCVGLDINANHVCSLSTGYVYGVTRPIHTGRTTHIWEIIISDQENNLICVSRLTLAIVKNKS